MPPSDPGVDRPAAVLAVTILGVVGSIVFLLLPLLVGAFTEELGLDARAVGTLASADMAGMFAAAAAATLWVRRADWRRVALAAAGGLAACHLTSAFVTGLAPLLLLRGAAGLAGGTLMSIALTSLGDARAPDRWFALFVSGQLGLGALALWQLPALLAAGGLRAVFLALAVLTAAAALAVPSVPRKGRPRATLSEASPAARSLAPGVLALAGCLLFNAGIMAVWASMERIGDRSGLPPETIGGALGASLVVGLIGGLAAAALVDRFGRALPLAATVILQLASLALLAGRPSAASYALAVALFSFCWNFPVAYQLAITVSVDRSDRLVVLFLSAVKLGYAIGPAAAGLLVASADGFGPVLAAGGACFLLAAAVYVPLAGLAARGSASPDRRAHA